MLIMQTFISDSESHLKEKALIKLIFKNKVKITRGTTLKITVEYKHSELPHIPGKTSSCRLLSTFQCDLQVPR